MPPAPRLSTLDEPMLYEVPLNVRELKTVALAKLLVFVVRAAPAGKTRSAPAPGAMSPTQLRASDQLPFVGLPPSQVTVEGWALSSSASRLGRNTGPRRP